MDDHNERDTVSMYFVRAAVTRLAAPARRRALQAAGIPAAWLAEPQARVPAAAFSALWLAVARELDDEFFGLDRRAMKVGSFALVCQAVIGCATLERALKRTLRGFSLFLDDVRGELVVDGAMAELRLHNRIRRPADRRFADETFLVLVHGLMCWLIRRRIDLTEVAFAHPRPAHAVEYTRMFSRTLRFDAPHAAMRFDARLLASPIAHDAASLQQFLGTAPQSVFLKYKNEDSWTARVRRRLRGGSPDGDRLGDDWPVFEALATEFGATPTTLRRRLEAEGGSYQGIKDRLRCDWAIDALCHSTLSIEALAASLGFHDASTFHRAFKRWTGLQPGEYRRRAAPAVAPAAATPSGAPPARRAG